MANGKLKRFKDIPLIREITQKEYMELYRARDPDKLACEKGIVDKRRLEKLLKMLSFSTFIIYGVNLYALEILLLVKYFT